MLVGYMRVSSADDRQSVDLQRDALAAAGVDARHLHQDKASGARDDRPGLKACLDDLRQGDVLVVWKLDRLGRSLPHLLAIVTDLKKRGVAFRSLTEQMGHHHAAWRAAVRHLRRAGPVRARPHTRARRRRPGRGQAPGPQRRAPTRA